MIQKQTAPVHTRAPDMGNAANVWLTTAEAEKYPDASLPKQGKRLMTGLLKIFITIQNVRGSNFSNR